MKPVTKLCRTLKRHRPRSAKELRKLGYHLRFLGSGAFRDSYEIKQLGVVIKFPIIDKRTGASDRECKWHARYEARALKRINTQRRLIALRRYLPQMHFHDPRTGVIVMRKYKVCRWSDRVRQFSDFIENMINDLFPNLPYELDLGAKNLGVNDQPAGTFVVLDLGLIEE